MLWQGLQFVAFEHISASVWHSSSYLHTVTKFSMLLPKPQRLCWAIWLGLRTSNCCLARSLMSSSLNALSRDTSSVIQEVELVAQASLAASWGWIRARGNICRGCRKVGGHKVTSTTTYFFSPKTLHTITPCNCRQGRLVQLNLLVAVTYSFVPRPPQT